MSFIWSSLLYLLLGVPLLILVYVRMQRRKQATAARLGSLGFTHDSAGAGSTRRRHLPAIFFLAGIMILIFSIARPQAVIGLPKLEGTVILTFDVSGSMAADDLNPTRMEAAKTAAREFVDYQPSTVLIGVVAFSDGGLTVQAPTGRREDILATIDRLVPRRGTSLGNGMLVALNTIVVDAGHPSFLSPTDLSDPSQLAPDSVPEGWYPSSAIVLLTDGENNQSPDPAVVADLAANLGVRIFTVGIGSKEGAIIKVDGFTVLSRLDQPLLQYISETTGGVYYNAGDKDELRRIYGDLDPKLSIKTDEMEVTSIFTGISMVLFLVGGLLSILWFGRIP